jgi:cytochrome c6
MRKIATLFLAIISMGWTCFAAEAGADVYKAKCQMCHGPNGVPSPAMAKSMNLRDLGSAEVQKQSDAEMKTVVEKGKGKMTGFAGKLTPEQVDEVVKYIRSFKK